MTITLKIRFLKALMAAFGPLSEGLHIAKTHGFTSGRMLDYVYRNQPTGRGWLGRAIDRYYLSHPGWQVVRTRRRNVERLLEWAICRQVSLRGEAFVLDIASGPAAYMQATLARFNGQPIRALCWDVDPAVVAAGQQAAAQRGLSNICYAFNDGESDRSFRRLDRRPGVVVASGFYDWIADDQRIRRSMQHVYEHLHTGGHFVFTMLAGHVDLAMTNALFVGFDGQPLSMKVRPADVVHTWAREVGFDIVRTAADRKGHHVVTVAQKS